MNRLCAKFRVITLSGLVAAMLLTADAGIALAADDEHPDLAAAVQLYRSEGPRTALAVFEKLLGELTSNGRHSDAAVATRFIGDIHWRLGNLDQARTWLNRALQMARDLGDRKLEGRAHNTLGLVEWDAGDFDAALTALDQANSIAADIDDRKLLASSLNNRGLVHDELGDYALSLEEYKESLRVFRELGNEPGQGDALGNIGGVHLLLGHYAEALDYYTQALAISTALDSKPSMTIDHGNLALSYFGLGRIETSLEHFDLALGLAEETGMSQETAYWQRGKANVLVSQGKYDQGLENHRSSLAIYEQSGARNLQIDVLRDLGSLMLTLGDPLSAEDYFQRAIAMAREVGQEQAITANLVSLGDLQFQREQLEAARALYSQAQLRSGAAGEMALAAEALLRLALVDREQGLHEAASGSARAALETAREIQATVIESQAWYALGESARARQDNEAAFEAYAAAESAAGGIGDPELLWQLHYGRAQTHEQAGDLEKAIRELTAAVQVIESVRERLSEQRFRAGWVEDKYQVYVDLVRLQLELGRVQQAFSTAERLRARSFLAQLDRSPRAELSGENQRKEAALRERIRQLQAYLAEEQQRLLPQRRQLAIDSFSGELMQAEREYQAFLDDQGAGLNPMQSVIVPQLEDIQRSLKPGDALIEYVVDEEKLMIFLVRPDRLTAVTASLPRPQLEARIDLVRELVAQPGSPRWVKPATSLSGYLLGPLQQDELLAGVRHLKLVPHGILNYLPFALLPVDDSGEQLLMEAFTLSYLPAAAALLRQEQARERQPAMLALAPEVARLRFAPSEARSVAAMFEPNARLLEGSTATETALKAQAADFQVLHFATHGVFNKNNPLLSGLELEADEQNDGLLEVHEILGLSLNAELVSLSACQTGLGSGWFNDIPAGDDFVGLTRAFLFSGSSVVLASLWEVDDRSTVSLMEGFYRHLGKDSADRGHAAALARVQRELRASKEFSHPFYWAPFVLVGQHRTAAPLLSQRG